jgi:hypothetical protein
LTPKPAEELDGPTAAAFSDDAKSGDVARLLAEVKTVTSAAEAAAEAARQRALDPQLSGEDVMLARREMDDAAFHRDRLREAETNLGEWVEALKALEADRRMQAEHERVLAERDRLAEEMAHMADPIVKIARTVSKIAICESRDRAAQRNIGVEVWVHPSGAAPAITALFQDALVWDSFIAVAGLQSSPVVSGGAGAKDKLRVRPSPSSPATV